MGIARSTELDEFLDDTEEEGGDFISAGEIVRKPRKPATSRGNYASWRNVEDYLETKRLKKSLSEYYELDTELE